jgi:hypothetical protein
MKQKAYHSIKMLLVIAFIVIPIVTNAAENDSEENTGNEKILAKSWWNQTRMGETLALKKSQRDKIDQLAVTYIEQKKLFQEETRPEQEKFVAALKQQDFKQAELIIDNISKVTVRSSSLQRHLKISVLQQLEKPQIDLLVAEFPQIISRPWLTKSRSR